jgi:hypothetical protein
VGATTKPIACDDGAAMPGKGTAVPPLNRTTSKLLELCGDGAWHTMVNGCGSRGLGSAARKEIDCIGIVKTRNTLPAVDDVVLIGVQRESAPLSMRTNLFTPTDVIATEPSICANQVDARDGGGAKRRGGMVSDEDSSARLRARAGAERGSAHIRKVGVDAIPIVTRHRESKPGAFRRRLDPFNLGDRADVVLVRV